MGPADEEGEHEIEEVIRLIKQQGLRAFEVETDYHGRRNPRHDDYEYQDQHQHHAPRRYNPYGYGAQSYMPMPPDFSPQAHYAPPIILPVIWERGGGRDAYRGDSRYFDDDDYRRQGGRRRDLGYDGGDLSPRPSDNPRPPALRPVQDDDKK